MIVSQSGKTYKDFVASCHNESSQISSPRVQKLDFEKTSILINQSAADKSFPISNLMQKDIPFYEASNTGFDTIMEHTDEDSPVGKGDNPKRPRCQGLVPSGATVSGSTGIQRSLSTDLVDGVSRSL
ncbi:hypothetical protein V6N11_023976 [Hibiscus sabdariffa]|uniref:Uncharacterized protein n=1 Tax=Hibiscus sabdariffa TaxID=183260 RepID=A0ABR2TPB8_9ROSI